MRFTDLLRISISNLKRRKLRSFLTILGVVIGTASIVTMVSLGLGMQRSLYREVEKSGGLKTISVSGADSQGGAMYGSDAGGDEEESSKHITDTTVQDLGKLEHVKVAAPVYVLQAVLLKGQYEASTELYATTAEGMKEKKLDLSEGGIFPENSRVLSLVYGNMALANFTEKGTGKGFYDTGVMPDIDLMKDSVFLVADADSYFNSQSTIGEEGDADSTGSGDAAAADPMDAGKQAKKYVTKASGVMAGSENDYNQYSFSAFCDLGTLKHMLQKEFAGRAIPGQPTTKSGKPYKQFFYTNADVVVDDIGNIDAVAQKIRDMGFQVTTNQEYLNSMKSQFVIVQAVLGGIGAVSLLVAAIGIANTMMMSVYERTKEIGVMKVLGCSLKNIRLMFLSEAAGVGLIGGFAGSVLSFLLSFTINRIVSQIPEVGISGGISYIPWWLVEAAMGFSMLIGIVAGLMPALRAMRLSPLAAIRSE